MGKQPRDTSGVPEQPTRKYSVVLLLGDVADTAWRMFVPVIGLMILGLITDKHFHTSPYLLILGLAFGCVLATLLVRNQLKRIKS